MVTATISHLFFPRPVENPPLLAYNALVVRTTTTVRSIHNERTYTMATSDNLAAALKHVRDGVADALGMDDGDPRLVWLYGQRRGRPGEYAVLVEIQ